MHPEPGDAAAKFLFHGGGEQAVAAGVAQEVAKVVGGEGGERRAGERGLLTGVGNSDSASAYLHDPLGRPLSSVQATNGQTYTFNYAHNALGLTSITYPSTRTVSYTHDLAGRVSSVGGFASAIGYAPHGGVTSLTLGNGVSETTVYSTRLQPSSMEAVKTGPGSLWKLQNFYCPSEAGSCTSNNGNVVSQKLRVNNDALVLATAYSYDSVNRITSAAETGAGTPWSQGYTLDRYGNLTPTGDQPAPSLACGTYNSSTNRCTSSGFVYSDAGNLTSYQGRTLAYDAESRQTTLTESGTTYTYSYDGEGRRVKKTGGGTTTVFVYDAFGKLAAEYASNSTGTTMAPEYLTADHLGSTRLVTDSAGAVKRRYDYFPFGQEIASGYGNRTTVTGYGTDTLNPKFTGKQRDYESGLGLDYFGARYFSAAQGRFTSPDPENASASLFNPQSWNAYSYALNSPYKYVDPDGEVPLLATAAIGAGIGAVGGAVFNAAGQLIENGGNFGAIDPKQVFSAALGGGVQGGLAGLTLGIGTPASSAIGVAVVNGASNIVGDLVTRESNDLLGVAQSENSLSNTTSGAVAFITGFVGGGVGARIANVRYPLPNVRKELALIANSSKRSLRPAKAEAFMRFANRQELRNTVASSVAGTSLMSFFSELWFRWVSDQPRPKEDIKSNICYIGQPGCPAPSNP